MSSGVQTLSYCTKRAHEFIVLAIIALSVSSPWLPGHFIHFAHFPRASWKRHSEHTSVTRHGNAHTPPLPLSRAPPASPSTNCRTPAAMSATPSSPPDTTHELHLRTEPLTVSQHLILGCSPLAGIYGSIPETQAVDTVKAALELGFLDLDTAPHYGLGLSETRLGRAVAAHGGGRPVRLWSKVGRVMKPHAEVTEEEEPRVERGNMPGNAGCIFPDSPADVTPVLDYTGEGVSRSHADSLKRLNAAAVHGLRVHDAEDEERVAQAMAPGGGIDKLVELRDKVG